jgi:hypothetical protein
MVAVPYNNSLGGTTSQKRRAAKPYGHSSAVWPKHPHEFCGLWPRDEALRLASASGAGAKRCPRSLGAAPHLPVRRPRLSGAGRCLSITPEAFAAPAAYGDLVAAILAIASTIALSRHAPFATLPVWLFNVWGAGDLLFAFYQGLFGVQRNSSNTFSRVSVCRLTTRSTGPAGTLLLSRKRGWRAGGLTWSCWAS